MLKPDFARIDDDLVLPLEAADRGDLRHPSAAVRRKRTSHPAGCAFGRLVFGASAHTEKPSPPAGIGPERGGDAGAAADSARNQIFETRLRAQ